MAMSVMLTPDGSIHLIVGAYVNQYDQVIATCRVRFKSKNDPTVIFYLAGPQLFQLPSQLVSFQPWVKRVLSERLQNIQNTLL
jgi:hypothetical protein